ncbi:hypothetical protein EMIT047CA2_40052 [Pseudomonas soli]
MGGRAAYGLAGDGAVAAVQSELERDHADQGALVGGIDSVDEGTLHGRRETGQGGGVDFRVGFGVGAAGQEREQAKRCQWEESEQRDLRHGNVLGGKHRYLRIPV